MLLVMLVITSWAPLNITLRCFRRSFAHEAMKWHENITCGFSTYLILVNVVFSTSFGPKLSHCCSDYIMYVIFYKYVTMGLISNVVVICPLNVSPVYGSFFYFI